MDNSRIRYFLRKTLIKNKIVLYVNNKKKRVQAKAW